MEGYLDELPTEIVIETCALQSKWNDGSPINAELKDVNRRRRSYLLTPAGLSKRKFDNYLGTLVVLRRTETRPAWYDGKFLGDVYSPTGRSEDVYLWEVAA